MFFDQPAVDTKYQRMLLEIAEKQRKLFLYRFDWEKRVPKEWPPKGLFGRVDKKAVAQYDAMVRELQMLKEQTVAYRREKGYVQDVFWWNIPWDQVEEFLLCDLTEDPGAGSWRFEREWDVHSHEGIQILLLRESGHYSNFSSSSTTHYAKESVYSESQQRDMVSELRRQQKEHDYNRWLFASDNMVYSHKSKTLYGSERDYLLSAEHYWHQKDQLDRFERSLYTEHITREVSVVSNSRHYECLYGVGAYHTDAQGVLDLVAPQEFELIYSRGSVPEDVSQAYANKEAAVLIAAVMADRADVRQVPMRLFGRDIMEAAPSYVAAVMQAELYTCLAHKIKITD